MVAKMAAQTTWDEKVQGSIPAWIQWDFAICLVYSWNTGRNNNKKRKTIIIKNRAVLKLARTGLVLMNEARQKGSQVTGEEKFGSNFKTKIWNKSFCFEHQQLFNFVFVFCFFNFF